MKDQPEQYQTSVEGRLFGSKRVYVVDGACFTALPAKNLTFTIMANAMRIAAGLAARFDYPLDEAPDLTRVAQYVALTKGAGPLHDELHALLAESPAPTALHRFFAALPPLLRERGVPHQLLVTTSYDLALEQAFLDAGETFDVVYYVATTYLFLLLAVKTLEAKRWQ